MKEAEFVLRDYYTVFFSRQLSILGRKEVHLGRAPFGIFGDGKELAQATKLVRDNPEFAEHTKDLITGNEVAFGSIGESSTSEGMFFETINAACVLQVPLAMAIWDNGFGISVPVDLQTAKGSISKALEGFKAKGDDPGCLIFECKGWDYPCLVATFTEGIAICREKHQPVIFHVDELTQPLGHSTSGSHERYKTPDISFSGKSAFLVRKKNLPGKSYPPPTSQSQNWSPGPTF